MSPCPECGGQARIVFSVHKDPTRGSYTPLSGKCASCNVTFGLNQGRVRRL